jgi:TolA-binding protein
VQDKWAGLTGEIKDGDQTLLSSADAAAAALAKIQGIGGEMATEKQTQIGKAEGEATALAVAMQTAGAMVDEYQQKILQLDGLIATLTRTFDLTMTDGATPVINQVRDALAQIKDKTITITANYVSAYSASGPVGGESIPQYARGTQFVPRTGLALVHQGEKIITAKDNAAGNYGGNTISLAGGITVNIQGGDTSQQTAAAIAKQVYPELQKLTRRQA